MVNIRRGGAVSPSTFPSSYPKTRAYRWNFIRHFGKITVLTATVISNKPFFKMDHTWKLELSRIPTFCLGSVPMTCLLTGTAQGSWHRNVVRLCTFLSGKDFELICTVHSWLDLPWFKIEKRYLAIIEKIKWKSKVSKLTVWRKRLKENCTPNL